MTVQSPYIVPGLNPDAVTQNCNLNQNSDTAPVILAAGRHGEQMVSELHGKRYHKASRGNLFWGTSGTAGASLIAPGQTTGSFILLNPATSTKYIEVEQLRVSGASTETVVVSGLLLEGSVQTPTGTLTGATVSALPLGIGNLGATTATATPQGKVYKGATITAMTFIGGLGVTLQATTSPVPLGTVDFDGTLVLAPGMCINVCSAITQGATIMVCDWIWSEFLP